MSLKEIHEELNRIYKGINDFYYDGKLPECVITIQSNKVIKNDAYGWIITKGWIDKELEEYYELNIAAEYLDYDIYSIAATMNHEMVHIYCLENDIHEVSKNRRYHNKVFKEKAEARGLKIDKAPSIGFSVTSTTPEFCEFIDSLNIKPVFDLRRVTFETEKKKKPRKQMPKYTCPSCGAVVRGKEGLRIICSDCDCEFKYVKSEDKEDEK